VPIGGSPVPRALVLNAETNVGGGYTNALFALGYQQEIPMGADVPFKPYVRTSFGYAAQFLDANQGGTVSAALLLTELGAHYEISDTIMIGLDPLSLAAMASTYGTVVTYRAMAYVGMSL
jgi:hypothetical protein